MVKAGSFRLPALWFIRLYFDSVASIAPFPLSIPGTVFVLLHFGRRLWYRGGRSLRSLRAHVLGFRFLFRWIAVHPVFLPISFRFVSLPYGSASIFVGLSSLSIHVIYPFRVTDCSIHFSSIIVLIVISDRYDTEWNLWFDYHGSKCSAKEK